MKRGRRPEKAIYRPPHSRTRESGSRAVDRAPPSGGYKLEIEVAPNSWHKQMIDKVRMAIVEPV